MGIDVTGLGSVADFANSVWGTIFGRKPTPEEQVKFEQIANTRDAERDGAKRDVMVAELNQGDLFTKRARPTIIYAGLAIIIVNHVINPWLTFWVNMLKEVPVALPDIQMPAEFWYVWGGVCSVYSIGRSAEKVKSSGLIGKVAGMITGNK